MGAQSLGEPRPEEILTADSLVMVPRAASQPEAARGVRASYELRFSDVVINARVEDGRLESDAGPYPAADLVIEAGPAIRGLLAGELSPAEAIASGSVRLTGDPTLLDRPLEVFQTPPGRTRVVSRES